MASPTIGVKVQLDGEKEYRDALSKITSQSKLLASEMKLVESEFDKNTSAQKKAKAQAEVLQKQYEQQADKVKLITERYEKSVKATGENSEASQKLKTELNKAQAQLNKYGNELKQAEKNSSLFHAATEKIGTALKGGFAAAVKTAAVGMGAVVVAAGKMAYEIGNKSIKAYAEFEQLEGGVKKLFGASGQTLEEYAASVGKSVTEAAGDFKSLEAAQQTVFDNANAAFKTTGMDANTYIQNVTGFSAALINSLGGNTQEAAKIADVAMRDISDNANTFGTKTAEELAQVYQALAKGTFTTLDNLNLGYGGTRKEMERLIADANKLKEANGEAADLSIDKFSDMVEAIHLIQKNMNIAGTTEKEALGTIQGSFGMLKSSWGNLLTNLANGNADISKLVGFVLEAFGSLSKNLLPVIQNVAQSIAEAVPMAIEQLVPTLPPLIMSLLPAISNSVLSLVDGILSVLPVLTTELIGFMTTDFIPSLLGMLPKVVNSGVKLIASLGEGIGKALPKLIPVAIETITSLAESLLSPGNLTTILNAAFEILIGLAEGLQKAIPQLVPAVVRIISGIVQFVIANLPQIVKVAAQIVGQLAIGLIGALPTLVGSLPRLVSAIVNGIGAAVKSMASIGSNIVAGIWSGISGSLQWIKNKISGWVGNVTSFIKNLFGIHSPSTVMRDEVGKNLALGIGVGFDKNIKKVAADMGGTMRAAVGYALPMGGGSYSSSNYNYSIPAINVYAAPGQNADDIANAVMFKIQNAVNRKGAVYG